MLKFMLKNEQLHFTENWKTLIGNMMANLDDENNTPQHIGCQTYGGRRIA
jgi:hypothetical protein